MLLVFLYFIQVNEKHLKVNESDGTYLEHQYFISIAGERTLTLLSPTDIKRDAVFLRRLFQEK